MATRKKTKAAKKEGTAAKKEGTAGKKEGTAPKKEGTAGTIELANQLFSQLQQMLASPVTLSSAEAAEFQRTFVGIMNSASVITKVPFTSNVTTLPRNNGHDNDLSVQYLEYKNSRLKDLIVDILLKR